MAMQEVTLGQGPPPGLFHLAYLQSPKLLLLTSEIYKRRIRLGSVFLRSQMSLCSVPTKRSAQVRCPVQASILEQELEFSDCGCVSQPPTFQGHKVGSLKKM